MDNFVTGAWALRFVIVFLIVLGLIAWGLLSLHFFTPPDRYNNHHNRK